MDIPVDASWSNQDYEIKEQDRFLPIANVGRVMKNALPPHAKLSKGSKVCIQECVSEFISFVTSQAVDKCKIEKRKTLNGEDILWAMYTLGFENYSETLKIYLAKYREFEQLEAERKPLRGRRKKVEDEDNYETDFLSKDLSPTNSDNANNYLKLNEGAPGFNLSNFSENQSASINYLLPNSNSNSDSMQHSNGRNPETSISNFEDFVEGINY